MAYKSTRPKTPTVSERILQLLVEKPHQSAIDLANQLGTNYWGTRDKAAKLAEAGKVTVTMVGKSPHYSLTDPNKLVYIPPTSTHRGLFKRASSDSRPEAK